MKGWLGYSVIAVVAYLVFLLATFPAAQAYGFMGKSAWPLRLYGVEGSVWSGGATDVVVGDAALSDLTWQWRPTGLFRGRLEYLLAVSEQADRGRGTLGRAWNGKLTLRDADLPVSLIKPYLGPMVPPLAGRVRLELDARLKEGQQLQSLQGEIIWKDAAVNLGGPLALGNVGVAIETTEQGIRAQLANEEGPLRLDGGVLLKPGGAYEVSGNLTRTGPVDARLESLLSVLGQPDTQGRIAFRYSGQLSL